MSKVRILGARLSKNPATLTIANEQGINGFVNVTASGKQFYVVDAMVLKGLTPVVKSQMVWADDNGNFSISAADYDLYQKGEAVEGKLVTFEDVRPYEVDGKTFTHVELLVLDGQSEAKVVAAFINRQRTNGNTTGGGANDEAESDLENITNTSGLGNKTEGAEAAATEPVTGEPAKGPAAKVK